MPDRKPSGSWFDSMAVQNKQGRRGRRAKVPDNLQSHMLDFIKLTQAWINRFDEVWFDEHLRLLESAMGAAKDSEWPEYYEYAINRMLDVADRAQEGVAKLKKGKTMAKRLLADMQKKRKQPPKKLSRPTQEKDYFGLGDGAT
jgi:hypothetical protein